jgi:hypothetical protein
LRSSCAVVFFSAAAVLVASSALAAPKDAQAKKALNEAMEVDYLNTDFDKAEQKLKTAIDACGEKGCAPELKAKLWVAIGSVQAGGKKQLDDAKDSFIEALKLDKAAALDPDVASTEITFAFEQARAQLKLGPGAKQPAAPPAEGLKHDPPKEQRVNTPVPLYLEIGGEMATKAKKVSVSYLGTGGGEWRTLVLKKVGERGWGIQVPCGDVAAAGELKYAITITGEEGDVLGTAGSRAEPVAVPIKKSIEGEPPHWPGYASPEACAAKVEPAAPKQCLDDRQCNADLVCIEGECRDKPPETALKQKNNWVTVAFLADVSFVSGDQVCTQDSQANSNFACFREDGSRYDGTPTIKGDNIGNNVNLGPALSTLRIVVGYDRLLLDNLTAGARVGFALNGAPEGADFLPVHLEGRVAYFPGRAPFASTGARPYLFVAGGLAQIDTAVTVEVLENGEACGADEPNDRDSDCTRPSPGSSADDPEPRIQELDAYKQAGFGFAGAGVGLMYAPTAGLAFDLSVRASVTFPAVTMVISPGVGVSLGF